MRLKICLKKVIIFLSLEDTCSKMIMNSKLALYRCIVCEFYNEEKARKYLFMPYT